LTTQTNTSTRRSGSLRAGVLGVLAVAVALPLAAEDTEQMHASHESVAPARLVEMVRNATRQYIDVNAAIRAGYKPMFGCVSGPERGAMGVHYVNSILAGDAAVDAAKPEALIYEPWRGGMRLVGVEYIVDAAAWLARHPEPPALEGQAFGFVSSPNRYGMPAFFELHVWAWRDNPNGTFSDWNTRVTCDGQ